MGEPFLRDSSACLGCFNELQRDEGSGCVCGPYLQAWDHLLCLLSLGSAQGLCLCYQSVRIK